MTRPSPDECKAVCCSHIEFEKAEREHARSQIIATQEAVLVEIGDETR